GHRFEEQLSKGHAICAGVRTLRRLGQARLTFSTFFTLEATLSQGADLTPGQIGCTQPYQ
ncbi:MAG: hypothetical protein VKI93_08400, partial [Synechococcus sp.]|nr:hypothetical protein [Synechococcus sp.]